jgi:MoxR-like ATPase
MTDDQAPRRPDWWIYRGTGHVLDAVERDRRWPSPPHWRKFGGGPDEPSPPHEDPAAERVLGRAAMFESVDERQTDLVNAALYLRRPLLVCGDPGTVRASLAYRVARDLRLGRVLRWPVTTRTTLQSALYEYDPIGHARDSAHEDGAGVPIGDYLQLGPLGTALLPYRLPRVLLIEELDQGEVDLAQELAVVFDEGGFEIRELVRAGNRHQEAVVSTADPDGTATVRSGRVRCHEFPFVVITCGDERDLPPTLIHRCLRLQSSEPDEQTLASMVAAQFPDGVDGAPDLVRAYLSRRTQLDGLHPDRLLDAIQLRTAGAFGSADDEWNRLVERLWQSLRTTGLP